MESLGCMLTFTVAATGGITPEAAARSTKRIPSSGRTSYSFADGVGGTLIRRCGEVP